MSGSVQDVADLRAEIYDAGFRPIPVYNYDQAGWAGNRPKSAGKAPLGDDWQMRARQDPPAAAVEPPHQLALNTGILCDGLRFIDIDIDDPTLSAKCRALAIDMLGETCIRSRANSAKCGLLYRAAYGEPPKLSIQANRHSEKDSCKIEVLGKGQQFVAYGRHQSGAILQWNRPPHSQLATAIPAVTESNLIAYLTQCASIIGAPPPGTPVSRPEGYESRYPAGNGDIVRGGISGLVRDGREAYMYRTIWAALVGHFAEAPMTSDALLDQLEIETFRQYVANVIERRSHQDPPDATKEDILEREGRGWSVFHQKWISTLRKQGEIMEEAQKPRPFAAGKSSDATLPPIANRHAPDAHQDDGARLEDGAHQTRTNAHQPSGARPDPADLARCLSIHTWTTRDIPDPDRILGDILTTTVRAFFVGRTGLGKTLLGLALAAAAASGTAFLGWAGHTPKRVLYLDGEMPAELIKPRAIDALRRLRGAEIPENHLLIFGRDVEEEARRIAPDLPPFAPLNTPEGAKFLCMLIDMVGGCDLLVLDNVMSLLAGDQKDETVFSGALDLITHLTKHRIGQIWLDHTGHNSDRQYGSSTKAWRFDLVGIMAPLPEEQQTEDGGTGFTLSFDHPGKARRRTPDNWREFAAKRVKLENDEWRWEPINSQEKKAQDSVARLKPSTREALECLYDALVLQGQEMPTAPSDQTTRTRWYAEWVRRGNAEPLSPHDDHKVRSQKQATFRARITDLKGPGIIGVDGERITLLRNNRP